MFIVLSVIAFLIGLIVHEGGGKFLFDWAGWLLVGLILFAVGHLYAWSPWRRVPPQ